MAADTVFKIADAFFKMFAPDFGRRVFMASVTRVRRIDIVYMAGDAFGPMVAIKPEKTVVLELRRFPRMGRVAIRASIGQSFVQSVQWLAMAGEAVIAFARCECFVIEMGRFPSGRLMALMAFGAQIGMQTIIRSGVTGMAALLECIGEQSV